MVKYINYRPYNLNMDLKDKKLLYELSLNARMPLNKLAKKINASSATAFYRMNRLKEEKILLESQAIIDNSLLGFKGYRVYFSFSGATTEKEKEIVDWLIKQKQISILAQATGFIDAVLFCWTKSRLEFHNFVKEFKEKYCEYISIIEICNYMKVHHFARNYLVENSRNDSIITIGNSEEVQDYDETDLKILEVLSKDARATALEISGKIKIQPKTAIARIKKMEKSGIIKGYGITIDLSKIGYEYHKANIIFNKNINYEELLKFTAGLKNSVYVDETTTRWDYELNMEVKNAEERDKIINKIKDEFQSIKEVRYFKMGKFLKLTYIPVE